MERYQIGVFNIILASNSAKKDRETERQRERQRDRERERERDRETEREREQTWSVTALKFRRQLSPSV